MQYTLKVHELKFYCHLLPPLPHHTTIKTVLWPSSGTTRVRQCQKRTSRLYGARED